MESAGQKPLSSFGKSAFDASLQTNADVDKIIQNIHAIENMRLRTNYTIPDVVERLLNPNDTKPRSRIRSTGSHKIRKRGREVREVKKLSSPLDNIPSSAHYVPNFDSVLAVSPGYKFKKAEIEKVKKVSNLDNSTMNEMVKTWNNQLRNYNFQQEKRKKESPKNHLYQNDTNQENVNEGQIETPKKMSKADRYMNLNYRPQRPTVRPPPDAPPPPKSKKQTPGLISSEAKRDSFFKQDMTPGPSDYQKIEFLVAPNKASSFNMQASRPSSIPKEARVLRDVRSNIDAIRPRTVQCVPFDKQSSREVHVNNNDSIWKEIEAEQARIIESLCGTDQNKKKNVKKAKQPFALQTPKPEHPFQHIMRKETEPTEFLDVERSLRTLDRPVSSFNMSTPSEKHERTLYRKSDAPDVLYDNVNEQFKNTIKNPGSPVPIARTPTRHSPYYYMPKPCGQGLYNPAVSSLDTKRTVSFSLMGERQYMLEAQGSFRKKTVDSIPPPLD